MLRFSDGNHLILYILLRIYVCIIMSVVYAVIRRHGCAVVLMALKHLMFFIRAVAVSVAVA